MANCSRAARVSATALLLAVACVHEPDASPGVTGALTAGPAIGPESRIDEAVYTDKTGDQTQVFAAPGGPGALLVWQNDSLPGLGVSETLIWFVRLGGDGTPIDRLPIPITPKSTATQYYPVAAWNGDRALVVWSEIVEGGQVLHGARIGTDGQILDPDGFTITTRPSFGVVANTHVLPAGDGFLVVWADGFKSTVLLTRVGRNGVVETLDGKLVALPATELSPQLVDVAPVTGGYLMLLSVTDPPGPPAPSTGVTMKAVKLDAGGTLLSTPAAGSGAGYGLNGALGSNGGTAVALWRQYMTLDKPPAVVARRLSSTGAWLDAAPVEVRPPAGIVSGLGVVWTGTTFICAWNDYRQGLTRATLGLRRMDANGTLTDAQPLGPLTVAARPVWSTQLVWTGSVPLVAMVGTVYTSEKSVQRGDVPDGVMVRVLGAGDLRPLGADAAPISVEPNTQLTLRAVSTGDAALVIWQDDRTRALRNQDGFENRDVYGARVTVGSGALTQSVSALTATIDPDIGPAIGWDGVRPTLTYTPLNAVDSPFLVVAHLTTVGTPDGQPAARLPGIDRIDDPQLLWNGTDYLLAGIDQRVWPAVRRLTAAGVPIDAEPIYVANPKNPKQSFHRVNLAAARLAGATLLVWQATITDGSGFDTDDADIEAGLLTAEGLSPAGSGLALASDLRRQSHPAIATDGKTGALIVWVDAGAPTSRLMGARFDAGLARIDPVDITLAELDAPDVFGAPALTWTGTTYAATWTRTSGGTITFAGCLLGADLHCQPGSETSTPTTIAAVAPPPRVATPSDAAPPATAEGIFQPSLIWTDTGGVLFYRRHDFAPLVDRDRLFARPIIIGGPVAPAPDAAPPGPDAPVVELGATGDLGDASAGETVGTDGADAADAASAADAAGKPDAGTVGGAGGAGAGADGSAGQALGDGGVVIPTSVGCSCSSAPADRDGNPWLVGLGGLVALFVRRRRPR